MFYFLVRKSIFQSCIWNSNVTGHFNSRRNTLIVAPLASSCCSWKYILVHKHILWDGRCIKYHEISHSTHALQYSGIEVCTTWWLEWLLAVYNFVIIVETSGFTLDIMIIHVSIGYFNTSSGTFFCPVTWERAICFFGSLVVWVLALALAALLIIFLI